MLVKPSLHFSRVPSLYEYYHFVLHAWIQMVTSRATVTSFGYPHFEQYHHFMSTSLLISHVDIMCPGSSPATSIKSRQTRLNTFSSSTPFLFRHLLFLQPPLSTHNNINYHVFSSYHPQIEKPPCLTPTMESRNRELINNALRQADEVEKARLDGTWQEVCCMEMKFCVFANTDISIG